MSWRFYSGIFILFHGDFIFIFEISIEIFRLHIRITQTL